MKGKPISGSLGITIKAPEKFSISGDSEVVPENRGVRKAAPEEMFIAQLVQYIQFLDEQKIFVQSILDKAQKRNGCKNCGKK